MKKYYLSCQKFTISITTNNIFGKEIINETAPIARKFIGQPLENLINWSKKFGDFKLERL